MIKIKGFVVLEGEKDSTIAIMDNKDYVHNFEEAIKDQITKRVYENKAGTTLGNLQKYQYFLYKIFKHYGYYEKTRQISNQPFRLFGTSKIHKFGNINDITNTSTKFGPIID